MLNKEIEEQGDKVLFGGHSTSGMKERLNVPDNRPLADFLPAVTLSAKEYALNLSAHVIQQKDLRGINPIVNCHKQSNQAVRNAALQMDVVFEDLPPSEDIRKVQRRIKADEKALVKLITSE